MMTRGPAELPTGLQGSPCPLCREADAQPFARVRDRQYFACAVCRLVHLAPGQRPSGAAEAARYRTHRNDPADPRYREFLNRLAAPLLERLPAAAHGLDYGSGPGPTLSVMLEARGFQVALYDPVLAPDEAALTGTYDFITCSETAEHFFDPGREFARLNALLRPGGWLAVMTELWQDGRSFAEWPYVRDLTHVCFYHPATMAWLAARFAWSIEVPHPNVTLFRKR